MKATNKKGAKRAIAMVLAAFSMMAVSIPFCSTAMTASAAEVVEVNTSVADTAVKKPFDGINCGKVAYYIIDGQETYDGNRRFSDNRTTIFQDGTGEFSKMVEYRDGFMEFFFRTPIQGTESFKVKPNRTSRIALNGGAAGVITPAEYRNGVIAKNITTEENVVDGHTFTSRTTTSVYRDGHTAAHTETWQRN